MPRRRLPARGTQRTLMPVQYFTPAPADDASTVARLLYLCPLKGPAHGLARNLRAARDSGYRHAQEPLFAPRTAQRIL